MGDGRKIRGLRLTLLLLLSALTCASCGSDAVYVEFGSGGGRASEAKAPQRIISLSPSATEVLYGVGAFERVVAVSDYDEFPPEVENLPKVGGWSNTNLEQVAALKPDLVVMTAAQAPFVKDKLEALGVRTFFVPDRSLEDALASIEQIGRAVGREREAAKLLAETRAQLEEVRALTRDLRRPRVLCVVDRVPGTLRDLYTATGGSFISQLIEIAGGESVAPAAGGGFGKITKEAVVTLDPEIIIDMVQGARASSIAEDPLQVWRELSQVKAVREGRVIPVRDTSFIHPSQFVGRTAQKLAALLHPAELSYGDGRLVRK